MVSVLRYMGIENEYGIIEPENPRANPVLLSTQMVTAYAYGTYGETGGPRWDYSHEDPLNDARGFRKSRASAHPSMLTDSADQLAPSGEDKKFEQVTPRAVTQIARANRMMPQTRAVTNVITPNGARFYVDHAHPEYSGPEVRSPRDAVAWDMAGDLLVEEAANMLTAHENLPTVTLFKNNTDGKGASYGTHENLIVNRPVPFEEIIDVLTPFLVTRPIFCGAGRVGIGQNGERDGYQLSQRADFIENDVGLETTLARPIINTRDEPHADEEKYRRLHVIVGDANLVPMSTYLKTGSLSAVLSLIENRGVPAEILALKLADPVAETQRVSHDYSLTHKLTLDDGRELTALEIQRIYFKALANAGADDAATTEFFSEWDRVLQLLETDPYTAGADVEWVAKLQLLERMQERHNLSWNAPALQALDIQWSQLGARGIAHKLNAQGAFTQVVTQEQVQHALHHPPTQTRAYFRAEAIRKFGALVPSANWDCVVFDLPDSPTLHRVSLRNPDDGNAEQWGKVLGEVDNIEELLSRLE